MSLKDILKDLEAVCDVVNLISDYIVSIEDKDREKMDRVAFILDRFVVDSIRDIEKQLRENQDE